MGILRPNTPNLRAHKAAVIPGNGITAHLVRFYREVFYPRHRKLVIYVWLINCNSNDFTIKRNKPPVRQVRSNIKSHSSTYKRHLYRDLVIF